MTVCSPFPFTRTEQPPFLSSRFDTERHPQTSRRCSQVPSTHSSGAAAGANRPLRPSDNAHQAWDATAITATNTAGTLSKPREPPESQQSSRALGAGAAHGWCMARTAPSIVSTSISSSDSSSPTQPHSQPQSASMCTAVHQASSSNSRDRVVFTTRTALSN